jgi:predicted nuclease of predicted toxin-antitoxin system
VKVLVDMNLSPRWAAFLAEKGFEAAHWSALGAADAADEVLFRHAAAGGWVILTNDLDFGAILAHAKSGKPSVVQMRTADLRPEACGAVLAGALRQCEAELSAGCIVTLLPDKAKVRRLPL